MTTIAWKDGRVAADSLVTAGDVRRGFVEKLTLLQDGLVFGHSGATGFDIEVIDWLNAGAKPKDRPAIPEDARFTGIICWKEDFVLYGRDLRPQNIQAPFYSIGSGNEFAMGAMAFGASAKEAVEVAARFDVYTGGEITEISLAARLSLPGVLDKALGRTRSRPVEAALGRKPSRADAHRDMGPDR
jgi:ATP-dependent protease HslVU (ClpYQ) peptidase subunit